MSRRRESGDELYRHLTGRTDPIAEDQSMIKETGLLNEKVGVYHMKRTLGSHGNRGYEEREGRYGGQGIGEYMRQGVQEDRKKKETCAPRACC